jgi:hypothetical protein
MRLGQEATLKREELDTQEDIADKSLIGKVVVGGRGRSATSRGASVNRATAKP